jgi:hypothetical protein
MKQSHETFCDILLEKNIKMKTNQILTFLFFLICLSSCKKEKQKSDKIEFKEIKLKDKFTNKLKLDYADKLTVAEFSPLYIGKISEEINISYQNYETVRKTENIKNYKLPKLNSLEIFIDTTRTIGIPMGFYEYSKTEKRNDKIANPIFIKNLEKDTLNVGYAEFLPIIIEAKGRNGEWKPIQEKFRFDCGTGIQNFYCAPKNIIISSMKKFKGTFKTKLRLNYDYVGIQTYSNEINGEVNEEQFNK